MMGEFASSGKPTSNGKLVYEVRAPWASFVRKWRRRTAESRDLSRFVGSQSKPGRLSVSHGEGDLFAMMSCHKASSTASNAFT